MIYFSKLLGISDKGQSARGIRTAYFRFDKILLILASILIFTPAAYARSEGPYFFATLEACIASGRFEKHECKIAFENAKLQISDRIPEYTSIGECRLEFQECDIIQPSNVESLEFSQTSEEEQTQKYLPTLIGVEIVINQSSQMSMPVLSKDNSLKPFVYVSLSEKYSVQSQRLLELENKEYGDIRKADSFEPHPTFSNMKPSHQFKPIPARYLISLPPNIEQKSNSNNNITISNSEETSEERKIRISKAPVVY